MKNFSLKKDGKRFLCGLVASGIAMTSGGVTASAASKKETILEPYSTKKDYNKVMDNPVEVMIPTSVSVDRDGSQYYSYSTVVLEFSKESINPEELSDIIYGANKLNENTGAEKFAYIDANESSSKKFKVNPVRKNSTKDILVNFLEKQAGKDAKKRAEIDHSKYAEFYLPILGNYSYKQNGKKRTYRQLEYIYFYVPYTELSNNTDLSKYAKYAYARYQDGSFDRTITWDEIKDAKNKVKTK